MNVAVCPLPPLFDHAYVLYPAPASKLMLPPEQTVVLPVMVGAVIVETVTVTFSVSWHGLVPTV